MDICDTVQHLWPVRWPLSQNSRCQLWNRSHEPVKVGNKRDCVCFIRSTNREEKKGRKEPFNQSPTCSMTSGAIQHGVPTNVFRTLFLVMSPPVAKKALTPKSRFEMFEKYTSVSQINARSTIWVRLNKENTNNYQQFARSRLHREEYSQLLDPWVRSENAINAQSRQTTAPLVHLVSVCTVCRPCLNWKCGQDKRHHPNSCTTVLFQSLPSIYN